MKLLFDHNLSPRLVQRLADLYPASTQVYLIRTPAASTHFDAPHPRRVRS